MRKFYVFVLSALMVVGVSAAVYADNGVPETYGGYQVVTVVETVNFSNGSAVVDAYCPDASWAVTGGGYFAESFKAVVIDNRNVDGATSTDPGRWHVTATTQHGASVPDTATLTAHAICTKLG